MSGSSLVSGAIVCGWRAVSKATLNTKCKHSHHIQPTSTPLVHTLNYTFSCTTHPTYMLSICSYLFIFFLYKHIFLAFLLFLSAFYQKPSAIFFPISCDGMVLVQTIPQHLERGILGWWKCSRLCKPVFEVKSFEHTAPASPFELAKLVAVETATSWLPPFFFFTHRDTFGVK